MGKGRFTLFKNSESPIRSHLLLGSVPSAKALKKAPKTFGYLRNNSKIVELKNNGMNNIESSTGEIVMYQPDETIRLEVRMGEETVWLSQAQMAELFQRDQSVIARHIRNIYKEEELEKGITCAKFAYMGHKLDIL